MKVYLLEYYNGGIYEEEYSFVEKVYKNKENAIKWLESEGYEHAFDEYYTGEIGLDEKQSYTILEFEVVE